RATPMSTSSPARPGDPLDRFRQLAEELAANEKSRQEFTDWQDRRCSEVRGVVDAVSAAARFAAQPGGPGPLADGWGRALAAAGRAVQDAGLGDHLTSGNPAEMPLSLQQAKELLLLGGEHGEAVTIDAVRAITDEGMISGVRFFLENLARNFER